MISDRLPCVDVWTVTLRSLGSLAGLRAWNTESDRTGSSLRVMYVTGINIV